MQRRLGTAALVAFLAVLAPAAEAGDEASITAESVLFQGETVASFGETVALFASSAPNAPASLVVDADRAEVRHYRYEQACPDTPGFPAACFPIGGMDDPSESYEIEDLVLSTNPSQASALHLQWTTDEDAGVEARGPASLLVEGACDEPCAATRLREDLEGKWVLRQTAWDVVGVGRTEFTVVGLTVTVGGDVDGEDFEATYNTGEYDVPADPSSGRPYRTHVIDVVEIETEDATFTFTAAPGLTGGIYGPVVAETEGPTQILGATGDFVAAGEAYSASGGNLVVPGALVVRPTAVNGGVLVLALEDAAPPPVAPPVDDGLSLDTAGAAVAAGVGGAALAAFTLAWFWPYLKYVSTALMVVPMYSRIGREDVLEHGKREEIFGLIRDVPGIHAHEISSRAAVGWGTTVYHLKLLENHGLIVGKRTGRYKRFFATAGGAARNVDHYAVLRNETTSAIAKHVLAHPGCIQKDVCKALGLAPSLVTWHMNRLEEVDLVKKVREGRTVRYYAGGSWGGLRMDFAPEAATATLVDAGAN